MTRRRVSPSQLRRCLWCGKLVEEHTAVEDRRVGPYICVTCKTLRPDFTEHDTHWQTFGACVGSFDVFNAAGDSDPYAIHAAKQICGECPVSEECLTFALEREVTNRKRPDATWGVYGGLTPAERRDLIQAAA